jgi:hypothetical protein
MTLIAKASSMPERAAAAKSHRKQMGRKSLVVGDRAPNGGRTQKGVFTSLVTRRGAAPA